MYAKVSQKGQVTIPKAIRQKLHIEDNSGVLFLIEGNEVRLKGVPRAEAKNLAGSLKHFTKKYVPLDNVREKVQKEAANEAAQEGLSD